MIRAAFRFLRHATPPDGLARAAQLQGIGGAPRKYARVLPYALRQWPMLTGVLAATVAGSAVTALQPWPLKILTDYALGDPTAVPGPVRRLLIEGKDSIGRAMRTRRADARADA
jgi:hypothetical protein